LKFSRQSLQLHTVRIAVQTETTIGERKTMNNKFDELTKSMAQSVSRRQPLKKFGVGLAGMALACFGLAGRAKAGQQPCVPKGYPCFPRP
jgi:hypothetical protein